MKKHLTILFLLFAMAEAGFGQFAIGVKVGYTASKLSVGKDLDSVVSHARSGFHAGIFARIGGIVYVQPEAYYTLSGNIFKQNYSNNAWEQRVTAQTLDIPVLIGVKIINTKPFNWRIMAGPEVSFLVNSKIKNLHPDNPAGGRTIQSGDINKTNWYVQVGTGVDILFLTFDLRYQQGLNRFINEVGAANYKYNSTFHMWVFSVGVKFGS